MPVYNDWRAATLLCGILNDELSSRPEISSEVLLVDDGSQESADELTGAWPALARISILKLRRNLGHQRAIAVGLCYIHAEVSCDAVLVMDSDGEDRPCDALRLLDAFQQAGRQAAIFASRRRRPDGPMFQLGYYFYRRLHRVLTGIPVRVGNFSVLPKDFLDCLVSMSELWSHYAACVFKSRLPHREVPADKGNRLRGRSKMNLVSLVAHGLSAISVFHEIVTTRILMMTSVVFVLLLATLAVSSGLLLSTGSGIPGWAAVVAFLLLLQMIQLCAGAFMLVFLTLSNRGTATFLPVRDFRHFIRGVNFIFDGRFVRGAV